MSTAELLLHAFLRTSTDKSSELYQWILNCFVRFRELGVKLTRHQALAALRPDRADELKAHAGALHVAMAAGLERRAAADEIDAGRNRLVDAPLEQRQLQPAAPEGRVA